MRTLPRVTEVFSSGGRVGRCGCCCCCCCCPVGVPGGVVWGCCSPPGRCPRRCVCSGCAATRPVTSSKVAARVNIRIILFAPLFEFWRDGEAWRPISFFQLYGFAADFQFQPPSSICERRLDANTSCKAAQYPP